MRTARSCARRLPADALCSAARRPRPGTEMLRRSPARLKADASLIVQKRLPWQVRKNMLRQQFWHEEEKKPPEQSKTPGIVVEILQAVRKRRRDPQLWTNLLDQALVAQGELSPQDMANVLSSMSDARFQHNALLDEFVRSLSYRADVKAMVTAMLALEKLGLPTDALRTPFLQHLSGGCEELSFGDCRRVLMALARCCPSGRVQREILDELCEAIVEKSEDCDPRDLIAVPQHLGRLRHSHPKLLTIAANAVATIIASRLVVLPLDALRALEGFLLLSALVRAEEAQGKLHQLAMKCQMLAAELLRQAEAQEVWRVGSQLAGCDVAERQVWSVWVDEVVRRREDGVGCAARIAQMRKTISRKWGFHPPEGLEVALRGACRPSAAGG